MSAPNLTVTAEPVEAGSLVYGALAAKSSNEFANGQLSLILTITNNEAATVHLNQVKVSFVGPPSVNASPITADLTILPSQTLRWFFGILGPNNNIIIPVPAPGAIKLKLFCDNFNDPAELDLTLGQYQSPAADGGYSFPARSADLSKGEYWTGLSAAHGAAGGGTQLFAYDLLIRAYDSSTNGWPTSVPGSDNTQN